MRSPKLDIKTISESSPHQYLLDLSQQQSLYAVFDAAQDIKILDLFNCDNECYQSLYQGEKAHQLARAAPYLVKISSQSSIIKDLMSEGWGKNWATYLLCDQSLKQVRKHLRRFLLVKTEDDKSLYFRFYDPRVLRTFLPSCNSKELTEFFGPIQCYLAEKEESGKITCFRLNGASHGMPSSS